MRRPVVILILFVAIAVAGNALAFPCRDYVEPMRIMATGGVALGYGVEMQRHDTVIYAANRGGWYIAIIDVTDLADPHQAAALSFPEGSTGFAVGPTILLVTVTGAGLVRYDLANPLSPAAVDTLDLGNEMLDVALAGDVAFVSMNGGTVRAVALNYPGGMLPLGSIQLPSVGSVLEHDDSWLYVGTFGHGLTVLDVSDPGSLQYAGSASFAGQPERIDLGHGLVALGGHGAPGGGGIVTVYDIADPISPQQVGSIIDPVAGNIPPSPTIATATRLFMTGAPTGLREYHLAGNTYELTGVWPGTKTHVLLDGGHGFLLEYDEIHTLDDGPVQPGPATELLGALGNGIHRDGYIYGQAAYTVFVIDVTDPSTPERVGELSFAHGNTLAPAVALLGPALYTARLSSMVDIVDIQDPTAPVHTSSVEVMGTPVGLLAENGLLHVVSDEHGIDILDIVDPWNPHIIGSCFLAVDECHGLVRVGDQLLLASRPTGIQIIDVSDPTQPVVGTPISTGPVSHLAWTGDRLLVGMVDGPLEIWTPAPGTGVWTHAGDGPVTGVTHVTIHGGVGYVLHGENYFHEAEELSFLDLSGAGMPVRTGGFPVVPFHLSAVLAADDWVAVNDYHWYRFYEPQCPYGLTGAPMVPPTTRLDLAAAPNPFNPNTRFTFTAPRSGDARLRIYDLRGRLVDTLLAGPLDAGIHHADWRGTDSAGRPVPSGVYHARLTVDGAAASLKVSLLK